MRRDEQKCAELIAKVRGSFPRPTLGGMYLAPPGKYSRAELDVAQDTADRLGLNIQVCEGTIDSPELRGVGPPRVEGTVVRPLP